MGDPTLKPDSNKPTPAQILVASLTTKQLIELVYLSVELVYLSVAELSSLPSIRSPQRTRQRKPRTVALAQPFVAL